MVGGIDDRFDLLHAWFVVFLNIGECYFFAVVGFKFTAIGGTAAEEVNDVDLIGAVRFDMNFHRFGMPVAVSIDKKVIFFAFPEQHDILLSASDFGVWVGVRVRAGESTHPSPITIEY